MTPGLRDKQPCDAKGYPSKPIIPNSNSNGKSKVVIPNSDAE